MPVASMIRTYSELITLPTFEKRYKYLRLYGKVGEETFGYDRYLNQVLYWSYDWRSVRKKIINRDNACDLACADREIYGKVLIHHLNPITKKDIQNKDPKIFDPENLICVSQGTHNAIHYGDESLLFLGLTERKENDTCLWK